VAIILTSKAQEHIVRPWTVEKEEVEEEAP
jgi:hypothetical protein